MTLIMTQPPVPVGGEAFDRLGFRSFKTIGPIPYPQRWHRDLLILATLDPAIEAIQALPEPDPGAFGVLMRIAGVERRVLAVRDEHASSLPAGVAVIVPRSYVLAEPRCSTARMVWSTRTIVVSPGTCLRTISELRRTPQGIAIGLLADVLSASSPDPTEAILSLVCAGQIDIDLTPPFSPDTIVRPRTVPAASGLPLAPTDLALVVREAMSPV